MLDGQSAILQRPSRPAFCDASASAAAPGGGGRRLAADDPPVSENGVTVSDLQPR